MRDAWRWIAWFAQDRGQVWVVFEFALEVIPIFCERTTVCDSQEAEAGIQKKTDVMHVADRLVAPQCTECFGLWAVRIRGPPQGQSAFPGVGCT